jgi:CRP-like cAMP-binding protein
MNELSTPDERVDEVLSKAAIFSQLGDRDLRKLAKLCTMRSFSPGDRILEEGSIGLGLLVITSGRVELSKTVEDQQLDLGTLGPGKVLGEIALLDDRPRSSSATALEPTECLLLTRDGFDTLVKKEPQIAWCLVPELAGRIRDLQQRAADAELEVERLKSSAKSSEAPAGGAEAESDVKPAAEKAEGGDEEDDEDEGTSELESASLKMMRLGYGVMAGTAKGFTEMARVMESFLDSMADETDLEKSESWSDLFEKMPDASVSAMRTALDESEKVPQEMVDAFRRYSDGES